MRFSVLLLAAAAMWGQTRGAELYGARCGVCHGRDGKGGEAPNLHKSRIVVLLPERRLFDVVKNGIPGGGMPPLAGTDEDAWAVVRYVHSIAKPGLGAPVAGDAKAGGAVFAAAGCANCHMVAGNGGVLGPDLSSIAIQSSSAEIRESILSPAAKVRQGFQRVLVRTRSGQAVGGLLKNEDSFSLQMMTEAGELRAYRRADVAAVEYPGSTAMPGAKLTPEELQNVLAFLDRQRAPFLRSETGFQNY